MEVDVWRVNGSGKKFMNILHMKSPSEKFALGSLILSWTCKMQYVTWSCHAASHMGTQTTVNAGARICREEILLISCGRAARSVIASDDSLLKFVQMA